MNHHFRRTVLEHAQRFDGDSRMAPVVLAARRALDVATEINDLASAIGREKSLSPEGKREKIRQLVAGKAHEINRTRKGIEIGTANLAKRYDTMQPPKPDMNNAAAAVLRVEDRRILSDKPVAEKLAMLLDKNVSLDMLQAAIEKPGHAGLTAEHVDKIVASYINRTHPGAVKRIEADEEAIDLLSAAHHLLVSTARSAGEFNEIEFDTFVENSTSSGAAVQADVDRQFAFLANAA